MHFLAAVLRFICVLLLVSCTFASKYDNKRGFKTYNLPEKNVAKYLKHKETSSAVHRHNNRDKMKEHPDVQKFLQWKEMHKAGHPDAGAAFAGKIPHDYIHLLGGDCTTSTASKVPHNYVHLLGDHEHTELLGVTAPRLPPARSLTTTYVVLGDHEHTEL
eukprot:gene2717-12590_t